MNKQQIISYFVMIKSITMIAKVAGTLLVYCLILAHACIACSTIRTRTYYKRVLMFEQVQIAANVYALTQLQFTECGPSVLEHGVYVGSALISQ